jgi:hypothetical protein
MIRPVALDVAKTADGGAGITPEGTHESLTPHQPQAKDKPGNGVRGGAGRN